MVAMPERCIHELDAGTCSDEYRDEVARRLQQVSKTPPWEMEPRMFPKPRFARLRWALRRVWPI